MSVKAFGEMIKRSHLVIGVACIILFSLCPGTAPGAIIRSEDIAEAVKTYVEEQSFWPGDAVRMEFRGSIPDVDLGTDAVTWRVQCRRNEDFIGNTVFSISFYEDGAFLGRRTVRVRLEVLMDVVVSSRSLRRDEVIGRGDIRVVERWFARPPHNIISDSDEIVGKKLRRSVKPNTEITKNIVRDVPVVKKGKPVKIIVENGLLGMTTFGISEQDGMCGELIKVRNVTSKKMIYARVMADSLVKVEF